MNKAKKEPKRTIRRNIWGNIVGYEGGKRVEEFGEAFDPWCEGQAAKWVCREVLDRDL